MIGRWLCANGWHKWRPTFYSRWQEDGANFYCERPGCRCFSREWPPKVIDVYPIPFAANRSEGEKP